MVYYLIYHRIIGLMAVEGRRPISPLPALIAVIRSSRRSGVAQLVEGRIFYRKVEDSKPGPARKFCNSRLTHGMIKYVLTKG